MNKVFFSHFRVYALIWLFFSSCSVCCYSGVEQVTVVANHASARVAFWVIKPDASRAAEELRRGECVCLRNNITLEIAYRQENKTVRMMVAPDAVYAFTDQLGALELLRLGPDFPPSARPKNAVSGVNPLLTKDVIYEKILSANRLGVDWSMPHQSQKRAVTVNSEGITIIPIKIYADDKLPLVFHVWEKRVRQRIEKTSDILERNCRIRLNVVASGTWSSSATAVDMSGLLRDFSAKVDPRPGVLAVGFTGHPNGVRITEGPRQLGVAGCPFYPYILVRESAPGVSETERLETLLHEIGHYLGAVHTPDENSIMRTTLKDHRSRMAEFAVNYDPLNALIMHLWSRELALTGWPCLPGNLTPELNKRITSLYTFYLQADEKNENMQALLTLLRPREKTLSTPDSQTVAHVDSSRPNISSDSVINERDPLGLMKEKKKSHEDEKQVTLKPESQKQPFTEPEDTAQVKQSLQPEKKAPMEPNPEDPLGLLNPETWEKEIVSASQTIQRGNLPDVEQVKENELPYKTTQRILREALTSSYPALVGQDAETERLIRACARAAVWEENAEGNDSLRARVARQSFLLSLGILLDPSDALQQLPIYGARFRKLDTDELKKLRTQRVRTVTALGRTDTCQHFSVSVALAVHLDPEVAEHIGLAKEMRDSRPGGSGFDVTDLAADLAGVAFSEAVLSGRISLKKIASDFRFSDYIPKSLVVPPNLKKPQNSKDAQETLEYIRRIIRDQKIFK